MPDIMPHNIQAEQAIIGALLIDPGCRWKAKSLSLSDWYSEAHAWVAEAILEGDGTFAGAVRVLEDKGRLERVQPDYIAQIADQVSTSAGIDNAIEQVKECARRREFISLCYREAEKAHKRPSDETAAAIRQGLGQIETADRIQIVRADRAVQEAFKEIEIASKHDGSLIGLSSGFADLDWHTGGFRPGNIIVLGARPGMGKTVFASNMAVRCGKPVLYFNLEMTARELASRDLAGAGKIDFTKLRTGRLQDNDWHRLTQAAGKLSDKPIYFVDTGNLSVEDIAVTSEKARKKYGIELVIIDYLQLIGGQGTKKREEFIAHISRSLKNLARELDIPILALAQLNRQCEQRNNKRPLLSDLRESGAIEQDADICMFLYRESMYKKDASPNEAELIIAKGRNIQVGTVDLVWEGKFQRFDNQYHV